MIYVYFCVCPSMCACECACLPNTADTCMLCCQLTVQASDGGVPPRRQQVKVTVTISTDKNLPSFDKDSYIANMTEDQQIGASVIQVTALDEDVSKTIIFR